MPGIVQTFDADGLTNMIALASREAPHLVGLLREVLERRLIVARYRRDVKVPPSALSRQPVPVLIVLSDIEGIPTGPAGWKSAKAAFLWANSIAIYCKEPTEIDYLALAASAEIVGQMVLVECRSVDAEQWKRAAQRNRSARLAMFEPPEGEAYPEAVAANSLQ